MKTKLFLSFMIGLLTITEVFAQTNTTTTTTTTTTNNNSNNEDKGNDESNSGNFSSTYIGFRFMPTVTKFDMNQIDNGTIKTTAVWGYGFGGILGFNLSKNIGLQGEVIYSSISQKYSSSSSEGKIDLSYINIPLMLVLNSDVSRPVNFNIAIGPQFGFNTGSKLETNNGEEVDSLTAVLAVKPMDFGIAYGAGLDFNLNNSICLELGFRGVYGLIDISETSNSETTNQYYILDRAHVKTYSGYVGLKFKF